MLPVATEGWKKPCVGDDVPIQGESDRSLTKTSAVIPEVVFAVHVFRVDDTGLSSLDDFVPEYHLQGKIPSASNGD